MTEEIQVQTTQGYIARFRNSLAHPNEGMLEIWKPGDSKPYALFAEGAWQWYEIKRLVQ